MVFAAGIFLSESLSKSEPSESELFSTEVVVAAAAATAGGSGEVDQKKPHQPLSPCHMKASHEVLDSSFCKCRSFRGPDSPGQSMSFCSIDI